MSALQIAVFGYGKVGSALAAGFLSAGHEVALVAKDADPTGATQAMDANPALAGATVAKASEGIADADIVVLAVPFAALSDVLTPLRSVLAGKTIIDATNPVGPGLTHGLADGRSGAQLVASLAPEANVVKSFNMYGFENLGTAPTTTQGVTPVMPFAGDDAAAKSQVKALVDSLGWDGLDVGPLAAAVDMEHLALLWIRLVRAGGHDPRLLWAAVTGQ